MCPKQRKTVLRKSIGQWPISKSNLGVFEVESGVVGAGLSLWVWCGLMPLVQVQCTYAGAAKRLWVCGSCAAHHTPLQLAALAIIHAASSTPHGGVVPFLPLLLQTFER